jgi:CheY-like chemotaxis protein
VFSSDAKTLQRIAPMIQRVLIVDPMPASVKLLADLLRDIAPCQLWTAVDATRALAQAERIDPHIFFVEQTATLDGARFTRSLRRSELSCRKAPVIVTTAVATASAIVAARDAGAHEFLRKPYTIKDLVRRLEAATLRPRDWVEGVGYVGPDRRRFNSGDYAGPLKRQADAVATPNAARIVQALKILKAAVAAIDTDPKQALRAMLAQADELQSAALVASDFKLRSAAVALNGRLISADGRTPKASELEGCLTALWAFMPHDEPPERSQAA